MQIALSNNMAEDYSDKFQHEDFYACAFILMQGYDILKLDVSNPRRVRFIMDCCKDVGNNLYQEFRESQFFTYKYALKQVKDKLFNDTRRSKQVIGNIK